MKARQLTRRTFLTASSALAVVACGSDDDTSASFGPAGVTTGGGGNGGQGGDANGQGGSGGEGAQGGAGGGQGGEGGQGGGPPVGPGPEPADPWSPATTVDPVAFGWGVQTGDVLPAAALVSVRTLEQSISLTLMRGVETGWEEVSSGQVFTPIDGVVQLELTELGADTTYSLAFYSADGNRRSRSARFRTALAPGERRVIRFGATSCLGNNNDPWPCMSFSEPEKLDFFLLLGDTIYADNDPDQFNYVEKFKTALSESGLQDTTAGTSVVATWDDHEIDNNWSWDDPRIQQTYDDALAAFRQAIPQREGNASAIWRKLSWGDAVDLFVLDCRGERIGPYYISVEQMNWLKQSLSSSTAAFKIILNSVPIFNFSGTVIGSISASDRWQGFPAQRTEILEHINTNAISGVAWISGDVHFGAIGKVDQPGGPGEDQWDIIIGPAGSFVNPASFGLPENNRMPVVVRKHTWTYFEADPDTGSLLCQFIDDNGAVEKQLTLQL